MRFLSTVILLLALTAIGSAATITTTEQLIAAMQKKYAKSWYKTATFVQKTTNIDKDGNRKVETWYEAMLLPGSLRIDFTPTKDGNGILFTDGQIYVFKNGKIDNNRPFVHPLMVLGFDIYRMPENEANRKVERLEVRSVDLSLKTPWQGRPVYVVGAKAGDAHSAQFWIDKKNLYFVRMIRTCRQRRHADARRPRFNEYVKLGGGWMSPEVVFLVDNKVVTIEEYSDLHANVTLPNKLFDPQSFATVHWKE
jgi:outer membrane lipoprotein-sorting protein